MAEDFNSDSRRGGDAVYLAPQGIPLIQIFPTSHTEKNYCQLLGSPSEFGLKQFDNKVRMPSTVQFTGIVKVEEADVIVGLRGLIHRSNLSEIKCAFKTKSDTILNMIIESMEEIGDPNRFDAMEIRVSLLEYLEHNPSK